MNKQLETKEAQNKPELYTVLPAVNFQFLYRKKHNQEFAKSFNSKKTNLKDAMHDFLSSKSKIFDIDEEVKVDYKDGSEKMIQIDARQDWDSTWYFILDNQMIFRNGYTSAYNGR